MTRKLATAALVAVTIATLVLDITDPRVGFAIGAGWLVVAARMFAAERRKWAAQDERDRMAASIERERRRVELCESGPRTPEFYRDDIAW